jgi:hypothetical protein
MRSVNADLRQFVAAIRAAKLGAAEMYAALADRLPGIEAALAVRGLAHDEADHARRLDQFVGDIPTPGGLRGAAAPGCGLHDESWPTSLMAAFALDQSATAALAGIATVQVRTSEPSARQPHGSELRPRAPGDEQLAETAAWIVGEERRHQAFAIGAFRSLAEKDPSVGRELGREMIVARDWVKQVFPRHAALAELAAAGVVPADAAKIHDTFLASLGDRVQDALGVLGDF